MSSRVMRLLGIVLLAAMMFAGAGCFSWDSSGQRDNHTPDALAAAPDDDVVE